MSHFEKKFQDQDWQFMLYYLQATILLFIVCRDRLNFNLNFTKKVIVIIDHDDGMQTIWGR